VLHLPVPLTSCEMTVSTNSSDAPAAAKRFTSDVATMSTSVRAIVAHSARSSCASGLMSICSPAQ